MARSQRVRIWGGLAVGLALAIGLLLWALGSSGTEADEPATDTPARTLRVVDSQGNPVHHARVLVLTDADASQGAAGSWSSETATLTLPPGLASAAVTVAARGFRSMRIDTLGSETELTLPRGVLIRLQAGVAPGTVPDPYGIVFQIGPAAETGGELDAEQRGSAIEMMDLWTPPSDAVEALPRGPLGLAVRASEAADGVLVPYPGRYEVRWGLLDPATGTWFTLADARATAVRVQDDERAQIFQLAIGAAELERTRLGLEQRLARIAAGETRIADD